MAVILDAASRKLIDGRNFATIATVNPDGSPHTSVVLVTREGNDVLLSTTATRLKARNIRRDPRVSLSIFDLQNPYTHVDIRGTANTSVDETKQLSRDLSRKYLGEEPPAEPDDVQRLVVRIRPTKVTFVGSLVAEGDDVTAARRRPLGRRGRRRPS